MIPSPPSSTRTDTPFPHSTLFRSAAGSSSAPAAPAFRRAAPAGRHGPRHRAPAGGLSLRRAAVQSRRQAQSADAPGDQASAAPPRHHLGLRNSRPGGGDDNGRPAHRDRSEEHTSGLQSLMRISSAVFCFKKKKETT